MLVIMGYGTRKRGTSMASLSLEVVGVVAGEQHSASGHGRSSVFTVGEGSTPWIDTRRCIIYGT